MKNLNPVDVSVRGQSGVQVSRKPELKRSEARLRLRGYLVPFGVDLLRVDGGVRVGAGHVHVVGLHDLGDLVVDAQDGLALFVGLRQRSFELLVSRAQTLRQ